MTNTELEAALTAVPGFAEMRRFRAEEDAADFMARCFPRRGNIRVATKDCNH